MRSPPLSLLILMALGLPPATWLILPRLPPLRTLVEPAADAGSRFEQSPIEFERAEIGSSGAAHPLISHVQILDFDDDGRADVVACDVRRQSVLLYHALSPGNWEERVLAEDLPAPAHATIVDIDKDGDRDILVSVLGDILPNDGVIGRLVLLEQTPDGFAKHVLLDDIRRVADCQAGDLDGDGDLDLAVAVFGYARGQVLWLENLGDFRFLDRELLAAPGTIHVPLADYDGDGDLDVAAVVSQEEEEVWGFENLGEKRFRPRRLWYTVNHDLGSAGLIQDDLDGDGDPDLILPVGDNLEVTHSYPQPFHGCLWFENEGNWTFSPRRIAHFGGTYAAAVGDLDGDGDRDVVLVSMFNNWDDRRNASAVWLENDGHQRFRTWQIDTSPTHRIAVTIGDLDNDGKADVLTGGMHLVGPFDRLGRLSAWLNRGRPPAP